MYYENTVLERPKQLNIGGKGKYCCIPVCKNAQYDKDWQKTNIGLFKFPDKDAKPELYKLRCNKIKTFQRTGGKDSFKVTNNTHVCEFHFNITDINISAGSHIKTWKPNVVPLVSINQSINQNHIFRIANLQMFCVYRYMYLHIW